jgi:ribose transport system substrate-binding protein
LNKLEETMHKDRDANPHSRRDFIRTVTASAGAAALLSGLGIDPALAAVGRSDKPLRAAFSNAGLQATWCAQGKQAAEHWASSLMWR